jgi:hypothetical protein
MAQVVCVVAMWPYTPHVGGQVPLPREGNSSLMDPSKDPRALPQFFRELAALGAANFTKFDGGKFLPKNDSMYI